MAKAKRRLLITLFAAMMVFAFGATAAFATYDPSKAVFNDNDYKTVVIDGNAYDTVRTVNTTFDGTVRATIDTSKFDESDAQVIAAAVGITSTTTTWKAALEANVYKNYIDLDNSEVGLYASYSQTAFEAKVWNYAAKTWASNPIYLKLKVPAYVDNYDDLTGAQKKATASVEMNKVLSDGIAKGWTFELNKPEDYEHNALTAQSFDFVTTPDVDPAIVVNGTIGTVPVAQVTVKAAEAEASMAKFYKDSESELNEIVTTAVTPVAFDYDGAAHTIVMGDFPGYSVVWSVLNYATGKYDTVLAPSITDIDVDHPTMKVKAVVTNTSKATDTATFNFNVSVNAATSATYNIFDFDKDGNVGDWAYAIDGSTYNPVDYVVVEDNTPEAAANKASNEAAVTANAQALKEYFNDYYEVKAEATKANPNRVTMKIKAKDLSSLTSAEQKALKEKYAQLKANFGHGSDGALVKVFFANTSRSATLYINGSFVAPEIEFTNSPVAVTYKAKALKKKAKSFTVTATSTTGELVNYKLINAPAKIVIDKTTGKITLKKGLKKGTYKIKVKAYLPSGHYGQYEPSETQAITIKVKK